MTIHTDRTNLEGGRLEVNLKRRLKVFLNSIVQRASYRVFVANNSINRKVLIVADEPSIKNLLALVKKVDSRKLATANGRPGLSTISRKSFDTAILDLRCLHPQPAGRGYHFEEIWPSMVGRVLVINAEVNSLKTVALVEKYIRQRHTLRDSLFFLKDRARAVIGRSPSPHRV
jgi:hypothetical protein